jgi:hypothetical protein
LPYERTFAWVLQNARRLSEPVPYSHPYGAVIWVNLTPAVENVVLQQVGQRWNPTKATRKPMGKVPKRKSTQHFQVTIFYKDGDRFERVYTNKPQAVRFAERQRLSPVVKRVRVFRVQ